MLAYKHIWKYHDKCPVKYDNFYPTEINVNSKMSRETVYNIACYYHNINQYDNAIDFYLALFSGTVDIMHVYRCGVCCYEAGCYEISFEIFMYILDNKCIDDLNIISNSMVFVGNYFLRAKKYEKMMNYYLRAIIIGNVAAIYNLANYYETIDGNHDEAIKYYVMALNKSSNKIMILEKLARLCKHDELLLANVHIHGVCALLGHFYFKNHKYDKAIEFYLKAYERNESFALHQLATCYINSGISENGIKYFLIAIEKGCSDSMHSLALHYKLLKNHEKCIEYFEMAVRKGNIDAMNDLANYYATHNAIPNAIKYFKMAINYDYKKAMYDFGVFLEGKQAYHSAIKYYKMVGNDALATLRIANIYRMHFKFTSEARYFDEAQQCYNDALQSNNLHQSLAYCGLHGTVDECNKYKEMELAKNIHIQLAHLYETMYDISKCNKTFENAIKYYSLANNKVAHRCLGRMYQSVSDYDNAIKYYLAGNSFFRADDIIKLTKNTEHAKQYLIASHNNSNIVNAFIKLCELFEPRELINRYRYLESNMVEYILDAPSHMYHDLIHGDIYYKMIYWNNVCCDYGSKMFRPLPSYSKHPKRTEYMKINLFNIMIVTSDKKIEKKMNEQY